MKTLFRLMDRGGTIWLDKSWQKKVGNSNQAGAGRTFKYLCQAKYLLELGSDRFQVTDLAKINLLQEIVIDKEASGPARIVKGKYQGFSGKKGEPYLLVLDSKYRPFFYRFVVSTDELFNLLDFKLEIIFQSSH